MFLKKEMQIFANLIMAGKPKLYKTSLTIYWINVTETRPLESTVSSGAISKQTVVPTCCRVQGELPIFCAERTRSVSLKVKLADSSLKAEEMPSRIVNYITEQFGSLVSSGSIFGLVRRRRHLSVQR